MARMSTSSPTKFQARAVEKHFLCDELARTFNPKVQHSDAFGLSFIDREPLTRHSFASPLTKNDPFALTKSDPHREHDLARANDCIGVYQHSPRRRRAK